jgi:hypothetical protein
MKAIDTLIINTDGRDPLSFERLSEFMQTVRTQEVTLRFNHKRSDHRTAVYDAFHKSDLHDAPELKIDPDQRWELAGKEKELKRAKSETLKDWQQRVDLYIQQQGFIVDVQGNAHWAAIVRIPPIVKSRALNPILFEDAMHMVYPVPQFEEKL